MPYELLNYRNGWRVCKTQEPDVCFSKKPLSLERAKKQKTAIEISERGGKKSLSSIIPYRLYPSTLKTKKWDLYFERDGRQRKVSFGNPDYEDYTIHKDPERKRRYLARATKIKGNWANDPFSPNSLAINVLWNTPKSPQENLRLYLKKLNIST